MQVTESQNFPMKKCIVISLTNKQEEHEMSKSLKLAEIGNDCVACGCCAAVCPKEAINIASGIIAKVHSERCVGCGKCEKVCPAGVITIKQRGAQYEKEMA